MDFTESIKKMFEQGQKNKYVPSIPMNMATPLEGAKVRFWTKQTMKDSNARTIIDNSLVGEFKEGYFIIETDSWSVNEVFLGQNIQSKGFIMSKTFKDKANHFKHHLSHGEADVFYAKRNKLKYKQEDIPDDVKEMVKTLEYNGAGDRHGNHRKMLAKTKVTERRIERKRENREFQKRVNEE